MNSAPTNLKSASSNKAQSESDHSISSLKYPLKSSFEMAELKSPQCASTDPLWSRLQVFQLDLPDVGLSFSERAARENAWSLSYTRRVIEEYKKFIFLAMRAGHVACPSDSVDQIWHMHLTYTRSYWEEMCGQTLNRPLHHGPTRGGSEEKEKYFRLYEWTKESYEKWFGEAPPSDIWPSAEVRFGEDLHFVRVNAAKHWILPRFGWKHAALGAGSAGLLIPIAQLAANPLNWNGPVFLAMYFGLLIIAAAICFVVRNQVIHAANTYEFDPTRQDEIGPIEAAWLQGGDSAAAHCALVDLAQRDAVVINGDRIDATAAAQFSTPTHRVSNLMLNALKSTDSGRKWSSLIRHAQVGLVGVRQQLEEKGLAMSAAQRSTIATVTVMAFGLILLLGAAKIWVGISRGRPVEILFSGELITLGIMIAFLMTIPRLTNSGKKLLASLRTKANKAPHSLVDSDTTQASEAGHRGDEVLLWGAGLLGAEYLVSTRFAKYSDYASTQSTSSNSWLSSGGCGATGCSADSGCGGGGGCGGGCGGCGGCGG